MISEPRKRIRTNCCCHGRIWTADQGFGTERSALLSTTAKRIYISLISKTVFGFILLVGLYLYVEQWDMVDSNHWMRHQFQICVTRNALFQTEFCWHSVTFLCPGAFQDIAVHSLCYYWLWVIRGIANCYTENRWVSVRRLLLFYFLYIYFVMFNWLLIVADNKWPTHKSAK